MIISYLTSPGHTVPLARRTSSGAGTRPPPSPLSPHGISLGRPWRSCAIAPPSRPRSCCRPSLRSRPRHHAVVQSTLQVAAAQRIGLVSRYSARPRRPPLAGPSSLNRGRGSSTTRCSPIAAATVPLRRSWKEHAEARNGSRSCLLLDPVVGAALSESNHEQIIGMIENRALRHDPDDLRERSRSSRTTASYQRRHLPQRTLLHDPGGDPTGNRNRRPG